jgi:hypothetical protein
MGATSVLHDSEADGRRSVERVFICGMVGPPPMAVGRDMFRNRVGVRAVAAFNDAHACIHIRLR